MKERLIQYYLDWYNNFISIKYFAEWHGVDEDDARALLDMGRKYHNEKAGLTKQHDNEVRN